mmetsp:Transcript_18314/g.42768  ORF Transcript_18314/g.42768 Transcript_18314/m.42768 type:complete len:475 (-) Transcript_18314:59-1483(-)
MADISHRTSALAAALAVGGILGYLLGRSQRKAKDLETSGFDERRLSDASCLTALQHSKTFEMEQDDALLIAQLRGLWAQMSLEAKEAASALAFTPRVMGCLLEVAASEIESNVAVSTFGTPAPRLPKSAVKSLRDSWSSIDKELFVNTFLERLRSDSSAAALSNMLASPAAIPANWLKFLELILKLLDTDSMPRLERIMQAALLLARKYWHLEMGHLAAFKSALIKAVATQQDAKDKRRIGRLWEALCYTLLAPSAPQLAMMSNISELARATAAPLPTPGGGPQAAAIAAQGVALLEMGLTMTAQTAPASASHDSAKSIEVVRKLAEARGWLLECVRDDVNAYCGLLATVFAKPPRSALEESVESMTQHEAEEAERRRWLRRATEVPLRVAEVATGCASACVDCTSIKESLKGDWLAGVHILRTAVQVSVKNVEINAEHLNDKFGSDVQSRLARVADMEAMWEALLHPSQPQRS